jgi:DNA replication and repair protein RecF
VYLERLSLTDFRSYREAVCELGPGVRVFVGPNAQGKTNLLESVHYLATGGSHRVSSDTPLVRREAESAIIRADAHTEGRSVRVELELRPGGRNRARLNGQPRARTREVIGVVRAVLFAPEDLGLVRGDPADRRRFLDDLLAQRRPAYAAAKQEYDRVLRQRNALLKDARRRGGVPDSTLPAWTDALVRAGATLLAARIAVVHALTGPADAAYRELLSGTAEPEAADRIVLGYELSTGRSLTAHAQGGVPDPAVLAEELRDSLADRAADERERGLTLVGPHRDELFLGIGDLPAKGFASHGESWSLALALRLASREILREVGEEPVVLLDDVFAELDTNRRGRLAARCAEFEQVLVTAAVDDDVPLEGPRYAVRSGTVSGPKGC